MEAIKLTKKTKWKKGIYPDPKLGLDYETRQLHFVHELTGDVFRINVQTRRPQSMKFNALKLGDYITGYKILKSNSGMFITSGCDFVTGNVFIIDPESDFTLFNPTALF
jgi:hypothetical protein